MVGNYEPFSTTAPKSDRNMQLWAKQKGDSIAIYDKSFPQLGPHCSKQEKALLLHLLECSFCLLPFIIIIFLAVSVFPIKCLLLLLRK